MFVKQVDPALDINNVIQKIEKTTKEERSIFAIVINQSYDGIYANLLRIELEIRGDPFWIGETDLEIRNRQRANKARDPGTGQFANYLRGESSFFLTFKTPSTYNENTGFIDLKESATFAGVYNIVRVEHIFSEGKFTQTLSAIRDINTNTKNLKRALNK